MRKLSFEEIKEKQTEKRDIEKRNPLYVVCENIRSLYNVGSIFRTADSLFIEKLYLCGFTGYPPRKKINKVALGAVETVPWEYSWDTQSQLIRLKEKNVTCVALEHTDESINFHKFRFPFPVALVIGNEYEGITQETLNLCDYAVEIPMGGIKQSLNVAIAFGIAGFEIIRQLNNGSK